MSDPDLLIDDEPTPRRKVGRPTREEAEARRRELLKKPAELPHVSHFQRPVGITFLAELCGTQPRQIRNRLKNCPVAKWHNATTPHYDFMTAMSYLVPPKGSIEDWFSQQNQASLPPQVSKAFWESMNSRIRAMKSSGQLWHDDDVLSLCGRLLMLFKSTTHDWVDELPGSDTFTDAQYNTIVDKVNSLNEQLKQELFKMTAERQTLSMAHTLKDEIEAAEPGEFDDEDSDAEYDAQDDD